MLPLLRDRLRIVLAPEQVTVVRLSWGWKPKELFNKSLPCVSSANGQLPWQPALDVLQQLLRQSGAANANATVLISNHFVRYQLIDMQSDLGSLEEEEGFVRFSFTETYGTEVERWSLRWTEGLDQASQVASAVDQALIDQIKKTLNAHGARLVSLQPYLMAAFNHVRKVIGALPCGFVLVESGRACVGLLRDGHWQSIRSFRIEADWSSVLPNILERELKISGADTANAKMLMCLPAYFDHKRLEDISQSVQLFTMTPQKLLQDAVIPIRLEVK